MTIDTKLRLLGYDAPETTGYPKELVEAVVKFQKKNGLDPTGMPDYPTQTLLRELLRDKSNWKNRRDSHKKNSISYAR